MAANQGVGGLYATVGLDISDAQRKLQALDRQFKGIFTSSSASTAPASGGMNRLSQSTRKATNEMRKADAAAKKTQQSISKLGRSSRRTATDAAGLKGQLKGISDTLSTTLASFGAARSGNYFYGLSSGLQAVTRGFGAAGGAASGFGLSLGSIVASSLALVTLLGGVAVGLRKITQVSNQSAANLERLTVSFEALLGSQQRAAEELQFLIRAAEISPYFTEAIVSLDRFLLAQGLLNDELRRGITQRLIDFGSAAGLSGDQLQNLAYALGQVYNAGRITGDEARQLRNNFLGVQNVLRSLPRYAEATGEELSKAMEAGQISSQDFFEGFFAYTARFGDAAAAQQQTLIGLKDTFVDVFQLGLGSANLELAEFNQVLSPLENLKAIFRELLDIFDQIDFRPLIASLGALVNTFVGPFASFLSNEGDRIKNFFEDTLPRAVIFAANIFRAFAGAVEVIGRAIGNIFRTLTGAFTGFVRIVTDGSAGGAAALKVLGRAGIIAVGVLILPFVKLAFVIGTVITLVQTLIVLLTDGWSAAADTFLKGVLGTVEGISRVGAGLIDAWNALDNLDPISFDDLFPDGITPAAPDAGDANAGFGFPASGGDEAGGASAAAKAMEKAMDVLFDLTQRWFDTRSALESGFLGKEGFEATVTSIVNTGKKLIEALRDISGADGLIRKVRNATFDLIDLARQREEVAEALAAADKRLADAIKARDNFAEKVRQSAIDFANAFNQETESVRQFQLFSERGFFYETEEKKQKSFVESLRERLDALRNFLANIKRLKSLGLDEGLLEQLVAAGPEQAGEVAAALAEGGAAMISEVNVLQDAVNTVANELGDFGANTFYQAGVDMAQAQVDGLTAQLASIEDAAVDLTQIIYDAVLPLAEEMENVGSASGAGLASGLEAGASPLEGILDDINSNVSTSLGKMSQGFADLPGSFAGGILAGESTVTSAVDSLFDSLNATIDPWFEDTTVNWANFWTGLPQYVAEFRDTVLAYWIQSLKAMDFIVESIVNAIPDAIEFVWNSLVQFLETAVAAAVNALNIVIRAVNAIPGVNISEVRFSGLGGLRLDIPDYRSNLYNNVPQGGSLLEQALSGQVALPTVNVYIGDQELTDIVDTRVTYEQNRTYRELVGGRRIS